MYLTVSMEEMPGRIALRPPEKPAHMCGSMKPVRIFRSASRYCRLTYTGTPSPILPTKAMSASRLQKWLTTR